MASIKRKRGHGAPKHAANKKSKLDAAPDTSRFHVQFVPSSIKSKTKKRKSDVLAKEEAPAWPGDQPVAYVITPTQEWENMKSYKNFQHKENKFGVGECVFINNGNIKEGEVTAEEEHAFWPAKILEIRAADASNVFARIYWLYWPEDLREGRQYYHGDNELFASNHMDVVDVLTISEKIDVMHFQETSEKVPPPDLRFWRQKYDCVRKTLSPLEKGCICDKYRAPHEPIWRCRNPECGKWSHQKCVLNASSKASSDSQQPSTDSSLPNGSQNAAAKATPTVPSPAESQAPNGVAPPETPVDRDKEGKSTLGEAASGAQVTSPGRVRNTLRGNRVEDMTCSFCNELFSTRATD